MKNLTTTYTEYKKKLEKEKKKKKSGSEDRNYILQLITIILLVAVVVVLILLVVNPTREASEIRNNKRKADISQILNEVSIYSRSQLQIPAEIPVTDECIMFGNEICKLGARDCKDMVDLSFLLAFEKSDITQLPEDPLYISRNGTGYYISQDGKGGITVCAPYSERNHEVSFTKYLY